MPSIDSLPKAQAIRLFLQHQGLLRASFGRGPAGVQQTIEQLGYVQIDTISVVDRAHHHALKSRIPNYQPAMLDKLQSSDRTVFEYWAHAAAYLPMKHYRYYLPLMEGYQRYRKHDKKMAQHILARIRTDGPLQAKDFDAPLGKRASGWWDWKPAKHVLEHLFLSGELMISKRRGFQKVYDLRERVLPGDIDTRVPDIASWARFQLTNAIKALGVASMSDLTYAHSAARRFAGAEFTPDYPTALQTLVESGEFVQVDVDGLNCVTTPSALSALPKRINRSRVQLLSPFDNLVINRKRTQFLFGFDYKLECYVPEPKRRFGYFCLPLLWGDALIGRLDCKVERQTHCLQLRHLQIEPHIALTDALIAALIRGVDDFATAQACETTTVGRVSPQALLPRLPDSWQRASSVMAI
jgi:uncharacterized protein YcaQ